MATEVNGQLINERLAGTVFSGVSIDSRTVRSGQLFIAVRGESDDGHKYIGDALAKGCAGIMVNADFARREELPENVPIVVVDDTQQAMHRLARCYRDELKALFIAVTGSNGKTTTKEIIFSIIKSRVEDVYRSPGNFNNLYGLPLAIFAMPCDARYGVFELGISVKGEMARLVDIARPDMAVITNVGPTHLETLETVENVAEEKFELVDAMNSEQPVLLNADDAGIMKAAGRRKRRFFTFGIDSEADYAARRVGQTPEGYPVIKIDDAEVVLTLFGDYQAYNVLAGYAVAKILGLEINPADLKNIKYDFAQYRGEIEYINGLTVIADCYNANPVSMKSGLRSYRSYINNSHKSGSTVIVGDMLELGDNSEVYHAEIGRLLAELDFDRVITVGPLSKSMYDAAVENGFGETRIKHFADANSAGEYLVSNIERGGIIYLKASRGIGLEKIITLLKGTAFRQN